jgi:hypothetical protein
MMKRFEEPTIEIVEFTVEDIITVSDPNAGEEDEF